MAMMTPVDVIKSLSESLFHVGEKKRLRALRHHNEEREAQDYIDLLSKVQGNACHSNHNQRMEHHGMEFWTYYYSGEHPDAVMQNEPVSGHTYGTEDQKLAIERHMLDPEFAAYNPPGAKGTVFDPGLIKKRWTGLMWVAEAALSRGNYKAAETTFRQALVESEKFKITEIGLSRTLSGLANSLRGLNRLEEAEQYYLKVLELDEHIVGHGNANMEEEFYSISRYFIEQKRYEEVIEVYLDLVDRLTDSVGRRDPMVARCLNELGVVLCKQGRFEEAEPELRRAVEILSQFSSGQSKQLAVALQNLARVTDAKGDHDEAENLLGQAFKILERESSAITSR